jgi:hypothetical protein
MTSSPEPSWRSRIVERGEKPASEFTAHPQNPRRHPEAQRKAIVGSLSSVGWVQGVVYNVRTGNLLDGHARIEEALQLGPGTPVPYTAVDISEEEERIILATLDPISALAEYDRQTQLDLLAGLTSEDPAMQALLDDLIKSAQAPSEQTAAATAEKAEARRTLAERFLVPPFSVLDARQGYWQERKHAWINLGIESELGRGSNLIGRSLHEIVAFYMRGNVGQNYQEAKDFVETRRAKGMTDEQILADLDNFLGEKRARKGNFAKSGAVVTPGGGMGAKLLKGRAEQKARQPFGQTPNMGGRPDNPEAAIVGYYQKLNAGMTKEEIVEEWMAQRSKREVNVGLLKFSDSGNDPQYYYRKQQAEKIVGRPLSAADFQRLYVGVFKSADALSEEERALLPALAEAWKAMPEEGPSTFSGTSIFDPVLCEVVYRWFSPPGGRVLDPFAGGSVRGIVAGVLGRHYVGVDLREEQVEANRQQAARIFVNREATVTDPEALTPVELRGDVWVKRDDLFEVNGARGGKARACLALLKEAQGAVAAGNRLSPMVSRVARVAEALKIPCRAHAAGSKELSPEEADAVAHGAEMIKIPGTNYLSAIKSRARKDAEAHPGWVYVPFGLECPEYFEQTKRQVSNLPEGIKRIVVTAGSGMTTAAIYEGLKEAGREDVQILAVRVGGDPVPLINRWASGVWQERVEIVRAASGFETPEARTEWWGIELDPHYEAKAAAYVQPGDLFWSIAIRAEDRPAVAAELPAVEPEAELPAWAKGYPLELLKALADVFREHDKGHTFGAFTVVKENTVADWLAAGSLHALEVEGQPVAIVVGQASKATSSVEDFSGARIGEVARGDLVVKRIAARAGYHGLLPGMIRSLQRPEHGTWVEVWMEKPEDLAVVGDLGLVWAGSKVRASSEIVGVWGQVQEQRGAVIAASAEGAALARLLLDELEVEGLAQAAEALQFADHYSGYNKGHTWSAVALRSYGGQSDFIIKPSEMSRKWKTENKEKLEWALEDTRLRESLGKWAEPLIAAIPGIKHRIRLMKLRKGQGELTRHADITDPDAGVGPGQLLRIHIPLVTNEQVVFEQWLLDGSKVRAHMPAGSAWYLDTRKPHTAVNFGETDRVHLVMDVESCPELLALLQANPAREHRAQVALESTDSLGAVPIDFATWSTPAPQSNEEVKPQWVEGDARNVPDLVGGEYDLVFSCPPYFNLEVYSEDPADLSCSNSYAAFIAAYQDIIKNSVALLKENRFACFVVSEIRNTAERGGFCQGFVSDTVRAFEQAGARLYNEAVLVTSVGSLPIRVGRHFEVARKMGRTHQSVLIFCKGDPRKATAACGPISVYEGGADDVGNLGSGHLEPDPNSPH